MSWDNERFKKCAEQIRWSLKGKQNPLGVPFFIYVYDPKDERICIRNFKDLARHLESDGFHIQVVYMGKILAYALRQTPYLEQGAEIERANRPALLRELSQNLPEIIAEMLLKGVNGLVEPLEGAVPSGKGAFLLRAGALFPFVHVSEILSHLENKTHWTVLVPFPGSHNPSHPERLRFLNETEGRYYRATVL